MSGRKFSFGSITDGSDQLGKFLFLADTAEMLQVTRLNSVAKF